MIALQIFASTYLTGVIWLVQIVHYPAFRLIEARHFAAFHDRHSRAMMFLVGPVMLVELGTAAYLARHLDAVWISNLALVLVPFGATFGLSVPLHERLGQGQDADVIDRLVRTNWVRTIGWTVRSLWFLYLGLAPSLGLG